MLSMSLEAQKKLRLDIQERSLIMTEDKIGEAISHPNIALIKYWGQKCISTNIPTNTSISILLPKLITKTTVMKSVEDEFHLDGKKQKINGRMSKVIAVFKDMSHDRDGICITSENNFPHSCGLASSASGYSALVKSLNNYYGLQLSTKEMSRLARLGSGSACRSIEEGISKWVDDHACKIGSWDDLRIFNIVVENKVKDVSSTEGMIRTVKTSTLFKARLEKIDNKIKLAEQYIHDKDFTKLGELVMRESNEMHAIFLDTFPPILYLNEKSMEIINEIHKINEDGFKAFYSFDAGPNPFIFVLDSHFDEVYKHFSSSYQIIVGK